MHTKTPIPWTPNYNYGCGWRDCPECGPMIELEIERRHQKRVANSSPQIDYESEWLAEAYGTGAERVGVKIVPPVDDMAARRAARAKQTAVRAQKRVRRSLSEAKLNEAQGYVSACVSSYRGRFGKLDRFELANQTWCELLNPSALVARRERPLTIEKKVERAFDRARGYLAKLAKASARDAATSSSGYLEAA